MDLITEEIIRALFRIEAIRRAIGRLVSGAVDVPVAYMEGLSERIRSDNAARRAITSEVADAVREKVKEDPAVIQRGLDRWTRQLGEKQRTREEIGIRTLGVLAEGEVPIGAAAPTEDFMRAFEDMAEKVSSAEMMDLMARILAGEVRKPGSVSRRTLAIVPVLDKEILSTLAKVRSYLLHGDWVHVPPSAARERRHDFALLSSVSITSEVSVRTLGFRDGSAIIKIGPKALLLILQPSAKTWFMDGAHLTPIGQELVSLLPFPAEDKITEIALGFKEYSFVEKVSVGKIVEEEGEPKVVDATEVIVSRTSLI